MLQKQIQFFGRFLYCVGVGFNAAGGGEAATLFSSCGTSSAVTLCHKQVTAWVETSQGKVLMFLAQHHGAANTLCLCGVDECPRWHSGVSSHAGMSWIPVEVPL